MTSSARVYLVSPGGAVPEPLSAYFHMVNRMLPADQEVLAVPPEMPAREALALMREHGYSQVPVTQGRTVLGIFSYRAFAMEALQESGFNQTLADLSVEEFLEHEHLSYSRLTDELRGLVGVLDRNDAVLVSGPDDLIAILTPMDVLRYLYRIANAFVLVEEIELALRGLIRTALPQPDDLRLALEQALNQKYRDAIPTAVEQLTFDDYVALIRDGRNWPNFEPVLGGTRERARAKLEPVRDLRNDLFHFKRELAREDHDRLAACRDWLLRCTRKIEAREERSS